jgi:hypothetical protein
MFEGLAAKAAAKSAPAKSATAAGSAPGGKDMIAGLLANTALAIMVSVMPRTFIPSAVA